MKKITWREARATWTDDEFLDAGWYEAEGRPFGFLGGLRAGWECAKIFESRGQKWKARYVRFVMCGSASLFPILIICLPVILHSGGDLLKYHAQRRGVDFDKWME